MNYRHFKYEGWLYGLAFLLALALRLIRLGAMPLNDAEAELALQALQLSQGLKPALAPQPAYILFTAPSFFLYGGGTNFLARLIPALAGSALVFAPRLFAGRLKPRPGLLLAFFIALDPGFTAVSRQAGGPILAIAFFILALGFANQHKPRLAGSFAALAMLGGPAIWPGLLAFGVAWAIYHSMALSIFSNAERTAGPPWKSGLREALPSFVFTFTLIGTLFFIAPNGLSAALASIPEYLSGWTLLSNVRAGWLMISLLAYQPFGILLAVMALIRGWTQGSRRVIALSVWLFVALLLVILYPARQVSDLAWVLIPLWTLAALELARYVDVRVDERREAIGAVLLTAFLWVFGWLNFISLVWLSAGAAGYGLRAGLVAGSFILLALSLILVAFGWSIRIAQLGAVWGLGLGLGALGLAGTFGVMGLRGMSNPELWWQRDIPKQAYLLEGTVDDLSEWSRGFDNALPVLIYGVDSPALEWALREHRPEEAATLDIASAPELVITNGAGDPGLAASYRGQDFTWKLTTSWELAQPGDWLRWLAFREMTQTGGNIILWAREDLFLGEARPSTP